MEFITEQLSTNEMNDELDVFKEIKVYKWCSRLFWVDSAWFLIDIENKVDSTRENGILY